MFTHFFYLVHCHRIFFVLWGEFAKRGGYGVLGFNGRIGGGVLVRLSSCGVEVFDGFDLGFKVLMPWGELTFSAREGGWFIPS